MEDVTEWFAACGWGVICHWLGASPSSDGGAELTAEMWNRRVDAFDVERLGRQLQTAGASHLLITIGQNSGHYMAPNHVYDQYVGIQPSKCSRRDLVADLYDELHGRGIELMAYLPSGAPAADPVAVARLGWEWGYEGEWPEAWHTRRTGKRLAAFQIKWERIIREWSTRWGAKVRGWWIDGCYFADEMYRHDDEPNFRSFAAALKAGNPEALVAFNPGVTIPVICHTRYEDYTAGEVDVHLPECPGPWVERDGHKARYHVMPYLGQDWGKGDPRLTDREVVDYTKHVTSKGGVVTWDVPIDHGGLIPAAFIEQLAVVGKAVRKA